jgi:very-short-patch-repair endonuclease
MSERKNTFIDNRKQQLDDSATGCELIMSRLLTVAGVEFIANYPVTVSDSILYYVDFFIVKKKCYIEVDGGYHNTVEQKKYDQRRRELITKATGWREIRFTNKQVKFLVVSELLYFLGIKNKALKKKVNKKRAKKNTPSVFAPMNTDKKYLTLEKKVEIRKLREKYNKLNDYPDPNIIRKH